VSFSGEDIALNSVDVFVKILGSNYRAAKYDSEQKLEQYRYFDRANNIRLSVVFSAYDNLITWITLDRIDSASS
jgi:hypothetical protein